MTPRDASTQRICPKCGHANSNISLFCAECGAVLNGSDDEGFGAPGQGAFTGAPMGAASDTQGTQPIRTVPSPAEHGGHWAATMPGGSDDANTTAPLPKVTPPVSSVTPPATAASTGPAYEMPPATWATQPATGSGTLLTNGVSFGLEEERPHSMRGFWFGVIAFLLILAVLGLYGWSILPDGGFRDTVTGWF